MGDTTEIVRAVLGVELQGVDEPILEYLSSLIAEEDGGPTRPLRDDVVPFLLSSGMPGIDDEDAGNALCDKIEEQLRAKFGGTTAKMKKNDCENGTTLLKAPLHIGKLTEPTEKLNYGDIHGLPSRERLKYNEVLDIKTAMSRKDRKGAQRRLRTAEDVTVSMPQLTKMVLPNLNTGGGNKDIQVDGIVLFTPTGTCLLEQAQIKLTYGRRYGLVGKNGIGKTTLLKAMAAHEIENFPTHLRILHVSQEVGSSDTTVVDAVMEADVELQLLLSTESTCLENLQKHEPGSLEEATELTRLGEVRERLDEIDAKTAESRARTLLAGLQFSSEMQQAPMSSMSGGWRVRAAIAAALFIKPEILLLDEPTNHLDLEAVLWLEDHLQSYPHTVVIVSHDRAFLNEVTTDVYHMDNKTLKLYKGNFDSFEKTKKEHLKNQIKEWERYKAERAHMQEFVDSFRYNAKRASLVQSRIKAIEKLEEEAPPEPVDATPFTFSIPSPEGTAGRALVQFEEVGFAYPPNENTDREHPIFSGVDFNIDSGEKIGIVGPNGAGKSTMLKIALGELSPTKGTLRKKPGVTIASFTQHHIDKLDLMLSPIENLMNTFPGTLEAAARSWVGGYGVQGNMQTTPCIDMSGGQKSRVAFALLAFAKPSLIVMDEPTNHLDLETIDALADALGKYTGGAIVVSHDQHFITNVCSQLWIVGNGRVRRFAHGFVEYKAQVLKARK